MEEDSDDSTVFWSCCYSAASVAALAAAFRSSRRQRRRSERVAKKGRGAHRPRIRMNWAVFSSALNDIEFKKRYRMSKESFRLLADKLRVQLQIKPRAPKKTGGMISVELRLSLTLRMLAGGSYLDIIDVHSISESSFWAIFHQVVHLLSGTKVLDNILFPYTDPAKLADIATGFAAKSPPGHMWGCVGALDGIAIRMWEPTASDCCNPRSYYNRKGFHALNCQAMVDSHGRFLWMDIRTPGSTHDSVAWRVSPLGTLIASGALPYPFWIAGGY